MRALSVLCLIQLVFFQRMAFGEQQRQMPRGVHLLITPCEELPFEPALLRRLMEIELTPYSTALINRNTSEEDVAVVIVELAECDESQLAVVRMEANQGRQGTEQSIELEGPTVEVRTRLLALSIVELLRSHWLSMSQEAPGSSELHEEREDVGFSDRQVQALQELVHQEVQREEGRATNRGERDREESMRTPRFDTTLEVRMYPGLGGALFGATFQVAFPISFLRIGLDMGAFYGLARDSLGDVHLIGVPFGLSLLFGNRSRAIPIALGPRIEIGWGHAWGIPLHDDIITQTLDGVLLSILLCLEARFRVRRGLWILVDGQAGFMIMGLDVLSHDHRATGIGGPTVGLAFGISF